MTETNRVHTTYIWEMVPVASAVRLKLDHTYVCMHNACFNALKAKT